MGIEILIKIWFLISVSKHFAKLKGFRIISYVLAFEMEDLFLCKAHIQYCQTDSQADYRFSYCKTCFISSYIYYKVVLATQKNLNLESLAYT